MVHIGVHTLKKKMPYAKGTIEFDHVQVVGMHMAIYVSL